MDADRFADLLRALSAAPARRRAVVLGGATFASLLGRAPLATTVTGKGKGKGKKRKKKHPAGAVPPAVVVPPPGPTCSDGVKNGGETGLDCGGPTCPRCANGQTCASFTDCRSGRCGDADGLGNTCQSCAGDGVCRDADVNGGCLCDQTRGLCHTSVSPIGTFLTCADCLSAHPDWGCVESFDGGFCYPPCGASGV